MGAYVFRDPKFGLRILESCATSRRIATGSKNFQLYSNFVISMSSVINERIKEDQF